MDYHKKLDELGPNMERHVRRPFHAPPLPRDNVCLVENNAQDYFLCLI